MRAHPALAGVDEAAIAASVAAHEAPFRRAAGDLNAIRDELFDCMWEDAGILRTADGLQRALATLAALAARLDDTGLADGDRAFNLAWHDWLNLRNLIAVSRVIATSALAREESRGAHFREDFPQSGDKAASQFIVVRAGVDGLALSREAVRFTRVRPGRSLLEAATPA